VITMNATDFSWVSDRELVQSIARSERRPSLLVRCGRADRETVRAALVSWCRPPVHICEPGRMTLPERPSGTLLLADVATLTLAQQMDLYDWLEWAHNSVQVVSIACEPLWGLVERGKFLEGLYYRLNVVTVDAKTPIRRSAR
jgi:transcriptional regulator of acetoin/glycerol metabolism